MNTPSNLHIHPYIPTSATSTYLTRHIAWRHSIISCISGQNGTTVGIRAGQISDWSSTTEQGNFLARITWDNIGDLDVVSQEAVLNVATVTDDEAGLQMPYALVGDVATSRKRRIRLYQLMASPLGTLWFWELASFSDPSSTAASVNVDCVVERVGDSDIAATCLADGPTVVLLTTTSNLIIYSLNQRSNNVIVPQVITPFPNSFRHFGIQNAPDGLIHIHAQPKDAHLRPEERHVVNTIQYSKFVYPDYSRHDFEPTGVVSDVYADSCTSLQQSSKSTFIALETGVIRCRNDNKISFNVDMRGDIISMMPTQMDASDQNVLLVHLERPDSQIKWCLIYQGIIKRTFEDQHDVVTGDFKQVGYNQVVVLPRSEPENGMMYKTQVQLLDLVVERQDISTLFPVENQHLADCGIEALQSVAELLTARMQRELRTLTETSFQIEYKQRTIQASLAYAQHLTTSLTSTTPSFSKQFKLEDGLVPLLDSLPAKSAKAEMEVDTEEQYLRIQDCEFLGVSGGRIPRITCTVESITQIVLTDVTLFCTINSPHPILMNHTTCTLQPHDTTTLAIDVAIPIAWEGTLCIALAWRTLDHKKAGCQVVEYREVGSQLFSKWHESLLKSKVRLRLELDHPQQSQLQVLGKRDLTGRRIHHNREGWHSVILLLRESLHLEPVERVRVWLDVVSLSVEAIM
ncbi:hypothetical protein SeLEV6574_g00700 [Synchytrium endobioticum]|uniref:Uncharacterized protein n=1 Tax=Synchytrium endobioticum TaxID=286115 RepID=A0A507DGF1_9FUNG|nr:hypothetical protein SeLEV6574_g00700 [Synchytrium endobioticum]